MPTQPPVLADPAKPPPIRTIFNFTLKNHPFKQQDFIFDLSIKTVKHHLPEMPGPL